MSDQVPINNFYLLNCKFPYDKRLSMVSGNGVNSVPRPNYRTYRKMADIGVQYEPQETSLESELPIVNSTVAEINTSEMNGCVSSHAELDTSPTMASHPPSYHRPLSVQSSTSTNSSNGELKQSKFEETDVDAICVQQCAIEEDDVSTPNNNKKLDRTEPDGFVIEEKPDSSCGLDCVYFTMQCCECTIL